ncbi:uncharacterized protein BXZ73DRAFT_51359 [Epithele typhae]|uniref:uncharacterized protein n=1 Tax=Epithele typhae TaxID=378194 RepID=UPI0020080FB0|nr:uncharacterized protein BXZ73DRAFT_51359 [Epithele typhae]KAH9922342.1 hypothetical protein BXZ73DRAFT_51359 [Epithele typhae]
MDTSAKKILETATIKTLHAHGFARSSTQANFVLADLLSRYLANLSATVAKYAEHAGRRSIVARDAIEAFGELGTNMDELREYCAVEGRDMARYAIHSAKRVEELAEINAQLALGLSHDEDDLIPLEWGPVPEDLPSEGEESEDDEINTPSDELAKADIISRSTSTSTARAPFTALPISNPSTPPRKRLRTASWQPPEHIPDYLPPFPTADAQRVASPPPAEGAPLANDAVKRERSATPPLQAQMSTATSSADYHAVVPYDQSSLAALPARHLPSRPPGMDAAHGQPPQILPTQPALLGAYHHLLTNPPPEKVVGVNPARYRVGLALVQQTEKANRWDAPATLYGSTAPNLPRVSAMPASCAIPIAKGPGGTGSGSGAGTPDGSGSGKGDGEEGKRVLPGAPARTITVQDRVVPSIVRQDSRIPQLARHVLSGNVYARTMRIQHPPVLQRGPQKLTYGPGVNAPWNSSLSPMPAATPAGGGKGKGANGEANGMVNGKEKEKEKEKESSRPLPDARLYATWNYEPKRFDETLVVRRRMGTVVGHPPGGGGGRARSESVFP